MDIADPAYVYQDWTLGELKFQRKTTSIKLNTL